MKHSECQAEFMIKSFSLKPECHTSVSCETLGVQDGSIDAAVAKNSPVQIKAPRQCPDKAIS
jgi:hypothetical protein